MKKPSITFEEAVAALDENKKKLVSELHNKAVSLGYIPFIAKAGKKDGNYKIEYKADKTAYVLFISKISKNNLSIGCKLLHLGKYPDLIDGLRETVRKELLESRPCDREKGCTAYVQFSFEEKEYFTCRHAMRLKTLMHEDVQSFWKLLEAEAMQRAVV